MQNEKTKAIIVGVSTKEDRYDIKYSLDELKNLAETLDIEVVESFYQNLDKPNAKTYLGKGKLDEIKMYIIVNNIELVIFNDELSPSQLRNNQEILEVECVDRTYIILTIFDERCKTSTARMEIKLARDYYELPRCDLLKGEESRIGGAGKTKGKGETTRELDRRHLQAEIVNLLRKLKDIREKNKKAVEKRKEKGIPIVALVGYTNAGKSTTMNTILDYTDNKKEVYAEDKVFATLSTSSRHILYDKFEFILTDTIGFISKMPNYLINSFYSTLEEVKNADLIIHVVDSSSTYINEQIDVVMNTLYTIGATNIPMKFLFNKWDKTISTEMATPHYEYLHFSNYTKYNLEELLKMIKNEFEHSFDVRLFIPYSDGKTISICESKLNISKKEYQDNGVYFEGTIEKDDYHLVMKYDLDNLVS